MTTRYTEGGVTVTLDDGLERFIRAALDAATTETVRILEAAAEEELVRAEAAWYDPSTGVTRQTGRSGQLEVVTTISADEVRVSLQSTDTSRVGGKPRAALIRRPARLSLVEELVTQGEWWEWKRGGKPVGRRGSAGKSDWSILVPNPNASDGRQLVSELIRKPMKARVKAILPAIGRAIALKAGGGRG